MRSGRGINDENWIEDSVSFNNWFRENGKKQSSTIDLCDTTNKTVEEAAQFIDKWVKEKVQGLNV